MGILRPKHKTVRVRVGKISAQIDVLLAPLIKMLWQNKIMTSNSCQENRPSIAWIQFPTPFDAINFLNVVAALPSKKQLKNYQFWDTLYGRMTREGQFGEWEYKCHCRNEGESYGVVDFNFAISLRFPHADLASVVLAFEDPERLKRIRV